MLLSRGRLSAQLSGPYGYGRALHERRTIGDLTPDRSLILPADLAPPLAAQAILGRDVEERYAEVIVRAADGALAAGSRRAFRAPDRSLPGDGDARRASDDLAGRR